MIVDLIKVLEERAESLDDENRDKGIWEGIYTPEEQRIKRLINQSLVIEINTISNTLRKSLEKEMDKL